MSSTPPSWSRRGLLTSGLCLGAGALWVPRSLAAAPRPQLLRLRSPEANRILNDAIDNPRWWTDASIERPEGELYDEIRLRRLDDGGYLAFVTGEGDEDFSHQQVVDTVWRFQDRLDDNMEGCVVAQSVGRGHDPVTGCDYSDLWMLADFSLFYGQFFQRMYKVEGPGGITWLPYEKLDASFVDPPTWQGYLARRDKALNDVRAAGRLRSVFGNVLEVTQIYGSFYVEAGQRRASRVSMIVKIGFGEGTGILAQVGSKLPPVIKAGLRSGFEGSVRVCRKVKAGTYR